MSRTREERRRDIAEGLVWFVSVFIIVCVAGGVVDWMDRPAAAEPVVEEPPVIVVEMAVVEEEPAFYREDVPLSPALQEVLYTVCEEYGVSVEIALGLIDVESGFDPAAVSPNGSYGLCQLNPKWFPADLSDEENIRTGIGYLAEQLERYDGELGAALTAYNAGRDTGKRVYAAKVLAAAQYWTDDKEVS